MRTRDALERLGAAGRPLVADAESLVDSAEEERVLARIIATDRSTHAAHRRRRLALGLAGAGVLAAAVAVAASGVLGSSLATKIGGRHRVALTGARIQMAGYHFRTPAGFKATSDTSCGGTGPNPQVNGFAAAASAAGGCVGVSFLIGTGPGGLTATPEGQPVDVGSYQGYYNSQADSGESTLYVELPKADPSANGPVYLALFAQDLTEAQLIAVAESGLPSVNFGPSTTTGTEGG
jgi:hypothetical protein